MERHFTAVIVKSGEWFAGTVKELSGVHTQGKTVAEVRENLKEAIEMVIESNARHFRELQEHDDYIEEDIVLRKSTHLPLPAYANPLIFR